MISDLRSPISAMNQDTFISTLHKVTPITDKILALVGAGTAASLTLGHLQTGVGILVGIVTLLMMIPRAILAWRDLVRKIRNGEEAGEDEDA